MNQRIRSFLIGTCVIGLMIGNAVAQNADSDVPQALFRYLKQEDKVFAWKLNERQDVGGGTIYDMDLTSQKWQGIVWKHALFVYEPKQLTHKNHVLLFVTGGSNGRRPDREDLERGLALAQLCSARVATIHQVPNQPLFGGRREDDLITETWLQYLKTGDETWPLLFPMVKSASRAMDAIEELAKNEWKTEVKGFVITGASKRGWTSWLTPVADKRIVGTAPIVIDVLNFRPQMKHQLDSWGKYSEHIIDYPSKGLIVEGDESPREAQLRRMMDPYTYRKQLGLPKLMVNGTNDPYWVVDAMRLYWPDLVGPKYVLQVPNAGHGLNGGIELALSTVAGFFQHVASETPLPKLTWTRVANGNTIQFLVSTSEKPIASRLWTAHSDTKDFRKSEWNSEPLRMYRDKYIAEIDLPKDGHLAHYGELQFQINGVPYSLCTLIQRD
ncbi:MAG: PhoPQ-activated protein PqaA family protein [Pirellulaceae bacterium]